MRTLKTIISTFMVAWLSACAHTATITQNSEPLESTSSTTVTAPSYDMANPLTDASKLAVQARQMTQLQARISAQWEEFQKRPKRVFVGANVHEPVLANYVNDWVNKIERVGNLNYPETARRDGIYGSVRLTISISADGRIESVAIDRSSGSKILDEAAIKIAHIASPYAPFPEEMRKKIDVLSITRTWTFTRSDQVDMSNELKN